MQDIETDPSIIQALLLNCTLKKSPEPSNTEALMKHVKKIMEDEDIGVKIIRPVDFHIEHSVDPDFDRDDWPKLYGEILKADIVVIGSPIWLGEKSSVATKLLERMYAHSGETNDANQYIYYDKVGGTVVTGNEDGGKHVAKDILYGLSHLGFTIPPQADAYWVGEAGPGPSYIEAGKDNDFTNKNIRIMTWNLMHFARMLTHEPIPAEGNQVSD